MTASEYLAQVSTQLRYFVLRHSIPQREFTNNFGFAKVIDEFWLYKHLQIILIQNNRFNRVGCFILRLASLQPNALIYSFIIFIV